MTQKEFEEKTGRPISEEGYKRIEEVLKSTGLDENEFCLLFKEVPGAIVKISSLGLEVETLKAEKLNIGKFLLLKANEFKDNEILTTAISAIGYPEAIKYKLSVGIPLCDNDREYINNNLK